MEDLLENFTEDELREELELRGFSVIDENNVKALKKFLRTCEEELLIDVIRWNGFLIYSSPEEALDDLKDDYIPDMINIVNKNFKNAIVINDHNNGIDFRKNDCTPLIEDIIRLKGWNYLYELLLRYS